jgi:hypothetical protein
LGDGGSQDIDAVAGGDDRLAYPLFGLGGVALGIELVLRVEPVGELGPLVELGVVVGAGGEEWVGDDEDQGWVGLLGFDEGGAGGVDGGGAGGVEEEFVVEVAGGLGELHVVEGVNAAGDGVEALDLA